MKLLVNINRLGQSLQEGDVDIIYSIIKNGDIKNKAQINNLIANQLVQWLKISPHDVGRETLERYAKMSSKELYIPFTLVKPEIIEQRIIAPLESAKRFACLGEYLASIALSGLVGEMLSVFIWDMEFEKRKNKQGEIIQDRKFFKNNFERLNQSIRINVIEAFGYISAVKSEKFRNLANNRNRILHSWTDPCLREEIEKNAVDCYSVAALLMKDIFKLELKDTGSLKIDEKVMKYINSREIMTDSRNKAD